VRDIIFRERHAERPIAVGTAAVPQRDRSNCQGRRRDEDRSELLLLFRYTRAAKLKVMRAR